MKTMKQDSNSTTPEAWPLEEAAERLRRIRRGRDSRLKQRRQQAREKGREIAAYLGTRDTELQKVIGFGSTYEAWRNYREDSDIDLAVIGGNWSLLSSLVVSKEFKVSLVELNLQNPEFTSHVLMHGEVLYERK